MIQLTRRACVSWATGCVFVGALFGYAAMEPRVVVEEKTHVLVQNTPVPVPGPTVQVPESDACKKIAPYAKRVHDLVASQTEARGRVNDLLREIAVARELNDQKKLNQFKTELADLSEQSTQDEIDLAQANDNLNIQVRECSR